MKILRLCCALTAATLMVAACASDEQPGGTGLDDGGTPASDGGPKNDGGDAGTPAVSAFSVGGTVSGLLGTGLVLQNNAGDDIPVAKNGTFTFPTKLAKGAAFSVTVKTQPTAPSQTCTVTGKDGTISAGDVTSVAVNCAVDKFTVGGTVTGLLGTGLVLQNNGAGDLVINNTGTFAFSVPVASGSAYAVTVKTQPGTPSQTCTITSGTGTVDKANITGVAIACTTNEYTVGGSVTGLSGTGLVLQVNSGDSLPVGASGAFTFATPIKSGEDYTVTVSAQPATPAQTCTVNGGSGTVGAGNVTSVAVNCSKNTYTIGGTASGLLGTAVLQNNGGDDLPVTADGTFAFATPIESGAPYAVSIKTQPAAPSQTCTLASAAGTVDAANVTGVSLTCVTNTFKVKGTVNGLVGTGLIVRNNGGDANPIGADGAFEFATPIASGQTYAVTVTGQPTTPSQTCTVTDATGTVGGADVTNVVVNCVTDSFTVGGTISGLSGSSLVLVNNLGDDLPVNADGTFTFATKVRSGGSYAVSVKSQPSSPTQTCVVTAGSGTVTNGNVVTVSVNCATNTYAVGGTTSGLVGTGLVLQNNNGDPITINGNGSFSLPTPVASGAGYSVSVGTQPTVPSQTCTVSNGQGTVTNAPITNVNVSCTTNTYSIGGSVTGITGGSVTLKNNGGDDLTMTADGTFTFTGKIASGANYAVTVGSSSLGKFCTATNGVGTVGSANVTNVAIQCVDTWTSCKALKAAKPASATGVYLLDPDGAGPQAPHSAFCEMTIDGGGWEVMAYIRDPSQWDWTPTQNAGVLGDTANGFATGNTMQTINASYTERVIIYLKLIELGVDLGTQWMLSHRTDGVPVPYTSVTLSSGWGYRDSYGYTDTMVDNVCTHGCETYRGLGMFRSWEGDALGWSGTQGGDYGCRDGNNICWMARGLGCNVGGARCAYLVGPGEGVIYGAR